MVFGKFAGKLKEIFKRSEPDEDFFLDLEDVLIEGDLGSRFTDELITDLRKAAKEGGITDPNDIRRLMKERMSVQSMEALPKKGGTSLYMFLGVNGVGKTTTIAKLSKYYSGKGYRVLIAAADTFRAAATEQLDLHAERLGVRIVKQQHGADPGAVIYDAIASAKAHGDDLILADTAGRMHNKENLLRELKKMDKIATSKGIEDYKKFLVIDATTGQNALSQAELFNESVGIDGIILTKYDSEARGGILIRISKTLDLPIAFICDGEGYDDIEVFDSDDFINSLLGMK